MSDVFIDMYRVSQYSSWDEAFDEGGVHSTIVHSIEAPINTQEKLLIIEDILEAIANACEMMEGGAEIETRIRTRQL